MSEAEDSILRGNDWMTDEDAHAILRFGAPKRDLYESLMMSRTTCGAPVKHKGHCLPCELEPDHDSETEHRFVTSHFDNHVRRCKLNCVPSWMETGGE
ncbi:MAG: hypothetical protein KGL39_53325 [Patescibacteria group bacterium]|nr:hypothetical protein [Patescibacteria group bacterium]